MFLNLAHSATIGETLKSLNSFNTSNATKIKTAEQLKQNFDVLLKRTKAEMTELKKYSHSGRDYEYLNGISTLLHTTNMASVLNNNKANADIVNLWKDFMAAVTRLSPEYKQTMNIGVRSNLRAVMKPEEFTTLIKKSRDIIPVEALKLIPVAFKKGPCDSYFFIGMVDQSSQCYDDLRKYYLTYEPTDTEALLNIIERLELVYTRTAEAKKIYELSQLPIIKANEYQKQIYLLDYDFFIKDYKSSLIRLAYLEANAAKTNNDIFYVLSYKYVVDYLMDPKPEKLNVYDSWLQRNKNMSEKTILRAQASLARFYVMTQNWASAEKALQPLVKFDDPKRIHTNTFFCLSSFIATKVNSNECSKFGRDTEARLARDENLHWSFLAIKYVFHFIEGRMSAKERKSLRTFLSDPKLKQFQENEPLLLGLTKLDKES